MFRPKLKNGQNAKIYKGLHYDVKTVKRHQKSLSPSLVTLCKADYENKIVKTDGGRVIAIACMTLWVRGAAMYIIMLTLHKKLRNILRGKCYIYIQKLISLKC